MYAIRSYYVIVLVVLVMLLSACATTSSDTTGEPAVTEQSTEEVSTGEVPFEEQGYRIAYILNGTATDIFKMAFDAAVAEGAALGIEVDCFTADGDDLRFQDIINQSYNFV